MNDRTEKQTIVEAVGLKKVFKDFWRRPKVEALRGISFSVKKGEIFGLLGPNGSGKSTTIKLLLGLLRPNAGKISVFGHDPDDMFVKQKVGYLPEETTLYPQLTAEETLMYLGSLFSLSREECRFRTEQLLEMTGLTHARKRRVGEFSKGMARRIGLAQALINDPELIILDEPTSGLDPIGCREVKDLIKFLGEQGKTVIMSSHLLADVQDICDYTMILYGGSVRTEGTMNQLLKVSELTSVTFPTPDEQAMRQILSLLPLEALKVENPSQTLEEFFLDVVKEAGEKVESSGAHCGSGAADYLRKREAVLERYLDSPEPEKPELVVEDRSVTPEVLINLLDENAELEEVVKPVDKVAESQEEINRKLKDLVD